MVALLNPALKEKLRNDSPRLPKINKSSAAQPSFVKGVNATRFGVRFKIVARYFTHA
jgi:hypothetical protein